jgi:hypothetical protein
MDSAMANNQFAMRSLRDFLSFMASLVATRYRLPEKFEIRRQGTGGDLILA